MKTRFFVLFITLCCTAFFSFFVPSSSAQVSPLSFAASGDTYVAQSTPTTNYGNLMVLKADSDDPANTNQAQIAYVQFTVAGVVGTVDSAILHISVANSTGNGPKVYGTSAGWDELALTYNNQPNVTTGVLADLGSQANGATVSVDVTSYVTGDGQYSFAFVPDSADGVWYNSRESGSGPTLDVSFTAPTPTNTPIPPTSTPTPTNTPIPPTSTPTPTFTPVPPTPTNTPTMCAGFSDGFESGNMSQWSLYENMSVQSADVSSGVYAARGVTTTGDTVAYRLLDTSCPALYYHARVKVATQSTTVNVMKFRSGTGATTGSSIGGIFITSTGKIGLRVDTAANSVNSTTSIGTGWHDLELYMNTSTDESSVWYDGTQIIHDTTDDLGTLPIGRVMLGENSTGRSYDVFFDDVVVSTSYVGAATPTPTPAATSTPTNTPTPTSVPLTNVTLPARAAFYYGWFPGAWNQQGMNPFTKYHPEIGWYDGADGGVIADHIQSMQYGKINVAIASWWGINSREDVRMPALLSSPANSSLRWGFYYEKEGSADPTQTEIQNDLNYLVTSYGSNPNAARVDGRLVVFVYNAGANDQTCSIVTKYKNANVSANVYLVMKVFAGYTSCADQPDSWHQYGPNVREDAQGSYSFTISPGFYYATASSPLLTRDPSLWDDNVRDMVASGASWQLVVSFNEWGEGTAIENATDATGYENGWDSASGYGFYLDCLHVDGVGCSGTPTPTPTATSIPPTPTPTATAGAGLVVYAAGDIASCSNTADTSTANIILSNGPANAPVLTLGDNAYDSGTAAEFTNCFAPTWGQFKANIHPAVGNHEYNTANASGYYGYYGAAAGDPTKGYYSFDLNSQWHVIVINSNCAQVGGCTTTSPQYAWIQSDLAANSGKNIIASWHHPRYSSGTTHGSASSMDAIFDLLANNDVDLILEGHEHNYERFAAIDAAGNVTTTHGTVSMVVGTGGKDSSNYTLGAPITGSVKQCGATTIGVLKMTLFSDHIDYQFLQASGPTCVDSGTIPVH